MNSFGHFLSSFVWFISFDFLEVTGRFEIFIHYFFFEDQKTKAQFAKCRVW